MAKENTNNESTTKDASNSSQQTTNPPKLTIVNQYIKSLAFKISKTPNSLKLDEKPKIAINVDVNTKLGTKNTHEVVFRVNCKASVSDVKIYEADLNYGGIFRLENIPTNKLQPILHVECARMLFPFARRIIADLTIDGGFFPILLEPIDFLAFYNFKLEQVAKERPADTKIN